MSGAVDQRRRDRLPPVQAPLTNEQERRVRELVREELRRTSAGAPEDPAITSWRPSLRAADG